MPLGGKRTSLSARTSKQVDAPSFAAAAAPAPDEAVSDENVPIQVCADGSVINLSSNLYDARRRELHVQNVAVSHVAETVSGQWIYRR